MNGIWGYILRRLLLMVPTLIGIVTVTFIIIQFVPGGPVEQIQAKLEGAADPTARITGEDTQATSKAPGLADAGKLDPGMIAELNKQYGFDQPAYVRYFKMIADFARFDLGTSYFKHERVITLILSKMPVSISLGLWTTLITYLIAIPLGVRKAVRSGTAFDAWTSFIIVVGYAIPAFLFAMVLLVLFAGGTVWHIFPNRGLTSDNWTDLSLAGKVLDYFWHLVLPISAMVIGAFASLTMLTKNSILEEIGKQYVITARAKGVSERGVLYGHVFRNAMLVVIAGFPAAFVAVLFTSSLLIEIVFSLDGLGLLSFEAALTRDYPVMLGSLFMFSLLGLLTNLLGDVTYMLVDPRIDFARRDV